MPPKKKAGRPKASASAQTDAGTAPATVTSKRGKVFETSAAASRPSRVTTKADLSFPSTAPERKPNAPVAPAAAGRKRSAPSAPEQTGPPRKRGRPAQNATAANFTSSTGKRGPGRPPKTSNAQVTSATANVPAAKSAGTSKKRGRPAKAAAVNEPPKKRGRPARASAPAVPPEEQQATPKKRGRPPLGGETTKIDTDDADASEQLEDELQDITKAPTKRGRPAKAKGKQNSVEADTTEAEVIASASGKQYWLMKAEDEGHDEVLANGKIFNTKFTIDDLRSKTVPEPWDGVRNPTAAKNMREMKQGDLAFFYASGGKTPAIVGIMEIVKEHEPDATAWDENSYGYVEDEKKRDRWCVVHVEFRKKLSKPITRIQLMKARDDGPLAKMQEFTAARLSVSKVSEEEWNHISSMIEAQEDDEGPDGQENDLPAAPSETAMSNTEADDGPMPTTDSIFPPVEGSSLAPPVSSRPASHSSRAGSAA